MPNHSGGLHHQNIRKRIHIKHEPFPHQENIKKTFDRLIYVVVILGPIMNLPQLFKVWFHKDASGVSFVSWMSFSIFSIIWMAYGVVHKEKPIMLMNFFLAIIQALIAAGVLMYG